MTTVTRPRSRLVDHALARHGTPERRLVRTSEHPCEGAKFHSPSPLVTSRLSKPFLTEEIWLCPTCMANLDCFLYLSQFEDMDWTLLREFGNTLREVGRKVQAAQNGRPHA